MKKLKLKETGKEVKIGEKLVSVVEVFGIPIPLNEITINETTLPDLIKKGIIISEGSDSDIDISINGVVKRIASRIGWSTGNLEKYFNNLYKINPVTVFHVLLKEIAVMIDSKYPDHINNSKEIWRFDDATGEIKMVKDLNKIKTFKNFAAFRSLEDALLAKNVLAPALKDLYGKQKD